MTEHNGVLGPGYFFPVWDSSNEQLCSQTRLDLVETFSELHCSLRFLVSPLLPSVLPGRGCESYIPVWSLFPLLHTCLFILHGCFGGGIYFLNNSLLHLILSWCLLHKGSNSDRVFEWLIWLMDGLINMITALPNLMDISTPKYQSCVGFPLVP